MNINEFINKVQDATPTDDKGVHWSKVDCRTAIDSVFAAITNALAEGDSVSIKGFGVFEVTKRAERNGVNPKTKEKIVIPATSAPKFRASKSLKDEINNN